MYFPGMSGGGGGAQTAGMSDQEAAMVKAVSHCPAERDNRLRAELTCFGMIDARSYGELSIQDGDIRRHGICPWRSFRAVYVECMWIA